jgi:hypothetical protein
MMGPDYEDFLDHTHDMVARVRAAKEAAQRKMEEFGDVSEYDVTIIYGQKKDSSGDDTAEPEAQARPERPTSQRQTTLEFGAHEINSNPSRGEE